MTKKARSQNTDADNITFSWQFDSGGQTELIEKYRKMYLMVKHYYEMYDLLKTIGDARKIKSAVNLIKAIDHANL